MVVENKLNLIRFLLYIILITLILSLGYLFNLQTCSQNQTALRKLPSMRRKDSDILEAIETPDESHMIQESVINKDIAGNTLMTSEIMQNTIQKIKQDLHENPPPILASGSQFMLSPIFKFPHPSLFKSKEQILNAMWPRSLQEFLKKIHPSKRVTITMATYDFVENLLNWLISAHVVSKPPLRNVLVLCFDEQLFRFLAKKGVNALYVPYYSVLKNPQLAIGNIWLTRMAVIRLLNHWGYHVRHFDSDAVILKNPEPLFAKFNSSDIIGSWGDYPDELGKNGPWKTTLCFGAALFRSSVKTELLWQLLAEPILDVSILEHTIGTPAYLKKFTKYSADDQCRVNFALKNLGTKWTQERGTEAMGRDENGLEVVILPQTDICRHICTSKSTQGFYVYHEVGGEHDAIQKAEKNSKANTWFLRKAWNITVANDKLTGVKWIASLRKT